MRYLLETLQLPLGPHIMICLDSIWTIKRAVVFRALILPTSPPRNVHQTRVPFKSSALGVLGAQLFALFALAFLVFLDLCKLCTVLPNAFAIS